MNVVTMGDQSLEQRVAAVEAKIANFENSLLAAAKMVLQKPQFSMFMPKEIKNNLREMLVMRGIDPDKVDE